MVEFIVIIGLLAVAALIFFRSSSAKSLEVLDKISTQSISVVDEKRAETTEEKPTPKKRAAKPKAKKG